MEVVPAASKQILQDLIGAGFCALVLGGVVYWQERSLPIATSSGLALALVGFAVAHLRFRLSAPRRVTADGEGVQIVPCAGPTLVLSWDQVTQASHSTTLGMKWVLASPAGPVVIRDDGIGSQDWRTLSALLCQQLGDRQVPIWVDAYY